MRIAVAGAVPVLRTTNSASTVALSRLSPPRRGLSVRVSRARSPIGTAGASATGAAPTDVITGRTGMGRGVGSGASPASSIGRTGSLAVRLRRHHHAPAPPATASRPRPISQPWSPCSSPGATEGAAVGSDDGVGEGVGVADGSDVGTLAGGVDAAGAEAASGVGAGAGVALARGAGVARGVGVAPGVGVTRGKGDGLGVGKGAITGAGVGVTAGCDGGRLKVSSPGSVCGAAPLPVWAAAGSAATPASRKGIMRRRTTRNGIIKATLFAKDELSQGRDRRSCGKPRRPTAALRRTAPHRRRAERRRTADRLLDRCRTSAL